MGTQVRLCDEDREHFGCEEWLTLDLSGISVADLEELSERFGFDPGDWPEPFNGQLTLEQAGNPDAKPKRPPWRNRAIAWMVLRQNGHAVSWDEAGAARILLAQARDEDRVVQGKGDTPETPSPASEPSMTTPSSTSGPDSPETA